MFTPCRVQKEDSYFPIGNTPAKNLLRDGTVHSDTSTKVLCLGCGDVRNILFTLWSEPAKNGQVIEFTTCDHESAVIARNVFLYSYLLFNSSEKAGVKKSGAKKSIAMLWDMYYHIFVTNDVLSAIILHLKALLKVSETLELWKSSEYGQVLKFLGPSTLAEVRSCWQRHLAAATLRDQQQITQVRNKMSDRHKTLIGGYSMAATCSAGLHWRTPLDIIGSTFRAYWKTGVVAGNHRDVAALQRECGGHINPLLFVASSHLRGFPIYDTADPLAGYNVAPALDKLGQPAGVPDRLAESVKAQFRDWCAAFVKHALTPSVQIAFHCGEALSLCYTIQRMTGSAPSIPAHLHCYNRPWSATPLDLDSNLVSDATHGFDIIDTSNLSNFVGMLNLLPATVPLLSPNANAVLYTEAAAHETNDARKYLRELLRADVNLTCLLINLVPIGYLLGSSSEHFAPTAQLSYHAMKSVRRGGLHLRLIWKRPCGGDHESVMTMPPRPSRLQAQAEDVASILFKWYLSMFSVFENLSQSLQGMAKSHMYPETAVPNYHTRETFVSLLGMICNNVKTDWSECFSVLCGMIERDRTLLVGEYFVQELLSLLHISGLHSNPLLELDAQAAAKSCAASSGCTSLDKLTRYAELPSMVCVVLVVPRHDLSKLDEPRVGWPKNLVLQMNISNRGIFEHSFFAIHACFGEILLDQETTVGTIEEDQAGWQGVSDLIVSCMVPSFLFLMGDEGDTQVSIRVASATSSARQVHRPDELVYIYGASVDCHTNLHLLESFPNVVKPPSAARKRVPDDAQVLDIARITFRAGALDKLVLRADLSEDGGPKHIAKELEVQVLQASPCSMVVKVGKQSRALKYPFSVDGQRHRARISRKQCWIEIEVPVASALQAEGFTLSPFPIVVDRNQLVPWNLGRVDLSKCQAISSDVPLETIADFTTMGLSQMEHKLSIAAPCQPSVHQRTLCNMKNTLVTLFAASRLRRGDQPGIARLSVDGNCDLWIVVGDLYHDQAVGSVCLDTYLLIVNEAKDRVRRPASARRPIK
jgi:hypothetical protein